MRTTVKRSGALLALLVAAVVPAQTLAEPPGIGGDYAPPVTQLPLPLSSTRPYDGGWFCTGEFIEFRQTNPLIDQQIAFRGFIVTNPSLGNVGSVIGSMTPTLDVHQLTGFQNFQPGFKVGLGYKFDDGSTLSLDWTYLFNYTRSAGATQAAFFFNVRNDLADSFITAPVFNFPPEFNGPDDILNGGAVVPGGAIGIWNAAGIMTIDFTQKFQQYDITYRVPYYETEDSRVSGIVGGRFMWIWERFRWITTDLDTNGQGGDLNSAIYTNIVSNRMYGPFIGTSCECYLGHGFATQLDIGGALMVDFAKERAKFELAARFVGPQSKKARTEVTVVPEVTGSLGLMWYPIEGVQVRFGYNAMALYNTVAFRDPVSFDFLGLDPKYDRVFRLFDGLDVGIGLIF
jgi:hypothetical protein